jgi:hypothetical protein
VSAVLRLIVLVPLGYVAAVVAAALTITLGAFGAARDDFPGLFAVATLVTTLYAGAAAFAPAALAILAAEAFAWRSLFYYLAVGGALGWLGRQLGFYAGQAGAYETRPLLYAAGGFVGGFVYWLIAGIGAGRGFGGRP